MNYLINLLWISPGKDCDGFSNVAPFHTILVYSRQYLYQNEIDINIIDMLLN